jgi:hypothetical protein
MPLRTYEVWQTEDRTQITLAPAEDIPGMKEKGLLGEDAELLWSFDASSWEEASAVHHLRMGWEPYQPEGESEECPQCHAWYWPENSGECWRCGYNNRGAG